VTLSEQRRPTTPPAFGQRPPPLCRPQFHHRHHPSRNSCRLSAISAPTTQHRYKEHAQSRRSSPFCHFRNHARALLCLCSATVVHRQAITDVQPSRVLEPSSTRASTVSHTDPCSELPGLPYTAAFFTASSHRCHFPPAIPQP
jgi:hypothetical protein